MVLQTLKVSQAEDVKKYISLVINGNICEYLMQEYKTEGLHFDLSETKRHLYPNPSNNYKYLRVYRRILTEKYYLYTREIYKQIND